MAEINLDASGRIIGRILTYAAKQALLGHTVNIFNCEKAVISGEPALVRAKYHHLIFETGQWQRGPYIPRMSDRFVKRMVRGMLEHKSGRGKAAFKRIMCYLGVPAQFKDKKLENYGKLATELPTLKYQTIGELVVSLGGKQ